MKCSTCGEKMVLRSAATHCDACGREQSVTFSRVDLAVYESSAPEAWRAHVVSRLGTVSDDVCDQIGRHMKAIYDMESLRLSEPM